MLRLPLKTSLAGALALALAACAPQESGTVLPAGQAQTAAQVQMGVVTGSRSVQLGSTSADEALGAVVGGVAGAAAGQQVGGGTGRILATGAGATAGAALGRQAGMAIGRSESIQWFVRLDNGRDIAVVQSDPQFNVGQRVRVISDSSGTRLAPA